jgi:hypothetical protein
MRGPWPVLPDNFLTKKRSRGRIFVTGIRIRAAPAKSLVFSSPVVGGVSGAALYKTTNVRSCHFDWQLTERTKDRKGSRPAARPAGHWGKTGNFEEALHAVPAESRTSPEPLLCDSILHHPEVRRMHTSLPYRDGGRCVCCVPEHLVAVAITDKHT